MQSAEALLGSAESGDRRALARLISAAERGEDLPPIPLAVERAASQLCVGITGAPGAGKSTLVSALTAELLCSEERIAVLAVDPSSPISRGALLGDRVRMHDHATSPQVFIRSMATRSHHGGLAAATQTARRLLQHCDWPLVLIETVGVGQIELEVVNTANLAVVVLNPGWGDEIQANKAGLMEIADIFVINKADRPGLEQTRRDLDAVIINRRPEERPAVVETVASEGKGVAELAAAMRAVQQRLVDSGELLRRRRLQLREELAQRASARFASNLAVAQDGDDFEGLVDRLESGSCTVDDAAGDLLTAVLTNPVAPARKSDEH